MALLVHACSPVKSLQDDELLHVKNKIEIKKDKKGAKTKRFIPNLETLAKPSPKYGMLKWRLNLHQHIKKTKGKGFKNWLKNKVGREPEIYNTQLAEHSRLRMEKFLLDEGYFNAGVTMDTLVKNKKVAVTYRIAPGLPCLINLVQFQSDSSSLGDLMASLPRDNTLRTGERYRKENLLKRRIDLAGMAVENGYLEVGLPDFLFFMDTMNNRQSVNIYIQLRPDQNSTAYRPYYIHETYIHQNYSLNRQDSLLKIETEEHDGLQLIKQEEELLKPEALTRSIQQRKGDKYSKKLTERSLSRLLDLGIFKFVNLKYLPCEECDSNLVDRHIYLTPGDIRDVSTEIRANTRSGNYLGSGIILTYTDRNFFRGAERFEFSISGAVETQLADEEALINTAEAGVQTNLLLPYLMPFKNFKPNGSFTPKTQISLSYNFERRTEFYTLSSAALQFGYDWQRSILKRHQFYPVVINRINVLQKTSELEDILKENPSLRSSFEDVYINGMQYIYSTSNKAGNDKAYRYFKVNLETSGNLTYLLNRAIRGQQDTPYSYLGVSFSQFLKTDFDFRYYFPLKSNTLVARFFGGVGYSYGNQKVLPYVKQYYAGGSSGIRAFRIRTLGPGSYINPDINSNENEFIDQTGDIKLEGNLEYRFNLTSILKGAFFLDAGNIWLLRDENDTREGGVFDFNEFYREIAIGAGYGFRLDISSFVIRLDLAFPLTKPYLEKGHRWVADEADIFNKPWRKENLIWNLALGYPF